VGLSEYCVVLLQGSAESQALSTLPSFLLGSFYKPMMKKISEKLHVLSSLEDWINFDEEEYRTPTSLSFPKIAHSLTSLKSPSSSTTSNSYCSYSSCSSQISSSSSSPSPTLGTSSSSPFFQLQKSHIDKDEKKELTVDCLNNLLKSPSSSITIANSLVCSAFSLIHFGVFFFFFFH
jgi:hypothetical protein